ncbi:MAG: SDR family oxidoreductase [Acidobacteria bacterium]|nr:SDR family oxidoreductase [Acidobacteriota bacterium]
MTPGLLADKVVVITGASQGFGLALARLCLTAGAKVLICGRTESDLMAAAGELETVGAGRVYAQRCDISSEEDVRELAATAERQFGLIDALVCNAAIQGPIGPFHHTEWSEWVRAIEVNLLGTAHCCHTFIPLLLKSPKGKILMLSGGGATKSRPFLSAYAASKVAIVRFGETLADELKSAGIDVNVIAPGAMNTRMLDELLESGPGLLGPDEYRDVLRQQANGGTPPELGSEMCVHLLSAAGDRVTGRLFSAPWDPWRHLGDFKEELSITDVYKLRRIVPAERGYAWEEMSNAGGKS